MVFNNNANGFSAVMQKEQEKVNGGASLGSNGQSFDSGHMGSIFVIQHGLTTLEDFEDLNTLCGWMQCRHGTGTIRPR